MNTTLIISLLFCIFLLIIFINILYIKKIIKENKKIRKARTDELKTYFEEEWKGEEQKLNLKYEGTKNKLDQLSATLEEKEKRYDEVNKDLDRYKTDKIKEIDSTAAEYEQRKQLIVQQSIDKYRDELLRRASDSIELATEEIETTKNQLAEVKSELEEERSRRAAINEEMRKAEEKERYNEIHSVSLTDNEKEDIHFLLSLEDRLHNKQVLYKLVWSTYLQQAYKNTFHNILGNRDPRNVIYCIENIKTGKKYIGKTSAEISKRWTEHIKTSLNIGSIKSTNIHKALYNHWDEFIFYILIETEKEKLSEMEKYYINFYESDKYGYNIKAGG